MVPYKSFPFGWALIDKQSRRLNVSTHSTWLDQVVLSISNSDWNYFKVRQNFEELWNKNQDSNFMVYKKSIILAVLEWTSNGQVKQIRRMYALDHST